MRQCRMSRGSSTNSSGQKIGRMPKGSPLPSRLFCGKEKVDVKQKWSSACQWYDLDIKCSSNTAGWSLVLNIFIHPWGNRCLKVRYLYVYDRYIIDYHTSKSIDSILWGLNALQSVDPSLYCIIDIQLICMFSGGFIGVEISIENHVK